MSDITRLQRIEAKIYRIRGQRIMLDSDLAELYEIDVKQLKRQVRRNRARFPSDFMLVLTQEETQILRCQIGTLKRGKHSKYLPFAFTEHGVAMLSSVLNSPRAIQANIAIVRAFMKLREVMATHHELVQRLAVIEQKLARHDGLHGQHAAEIQAIFRAIRQLMGPSKRKLRIGFKP